MIFLLPTVLLFVFGYLIGYKKMTDLISGYNTSSQKEKEKYDIKQLTKHMSRFIFLLAYELLTLSIITMLIPSNQDTIIIVGFIILGLTIIVGIIRLNFNKSIYK